VPSLLISIAWSSLQRAGIPITRRLDLDQDAELILYLLLQQTEGMNAHSKYNSLLRRFTSFQHALPVTKRLSPPGGPISVSLRDANPISLGITKERRFFEQRLPQLMSSWPPSLKSAPPSTPRGRAPILPNALLGASDGESFSARSKWTSIR